MTVAHMQEVRLHHEKCWMHEAMLKVYRPTFRANCLASQGAIWRLEASTAACMSIAHDSSLLRACMPGAS